MAVRRADSSKACTDLQNAASSSRMWTRGLSCIDYATYRCDRKRKAEDGAAIWIGLGPKTPIMAFDDGTADGEAEPHAGALGRNERLEKTVEDLGSKPWPTVGD